MKKYPIKPEIIPNINKTLNLSGDVTIKEITVCIPDKGQISIEFIYTNEQTYTRQPKGVYIDKLPRVTIQDCIDYLKTSAARKTYKNFGLYFNAEKQKIEFSLVQQAMYYVKYGTDILIDYSSTTHTNDSNEKTHTIQSYKLTSKKENYIYTLEISCCTFCCLGKSVYYYHETIEDISKPIYCCFLENDKSPENKLISLKTGRSKCTEGYKNPIEDTFKKMHQYYTDFVEQQKKLHLNK